MKPIITLLVWISVSSVASADMFDGYLARTNCRQYVNLRAIEHRRRTQGYPNVPEGNYRLSKKQLERVAELNREYAEQAEKLRREIGAPKVDVRKRTVLNKEGGAKWTSFLTAKQKLSSRLAPLYVKILTPKQRQYAAKEMAAQGFFLRNKAMHDALKLTEEQRKAIAERMEDADRLRNGSFDQNVLEHAMKIVTDDFIKAVLTPQQRNQYSEFRLTDEEFIKAFGKAAFEAKRGKKDR